jgi:PAS domain S-box-containing protein
MKQPGRLGLGSDGWWVFAAGLLFLCAVMGRSDTALSQVVDSDPEYLLRKWETEEGLPENSATAIVQTAEGYLAIGTFGGLVRFDGVRFGIYGEPRQSPVPQQGVVNLHWDHADRLWISTLEGLSVLAHDQWRAFGQADGWSGDYVRTFAERANGDLLVTTFDGQILEFHGDRFHALTLPPGELGKGFFGFVDEKDRWCVAQHAFVGYFDGHDWLGTSLPNSVAADQVATAPSHDGSQWVLMGRQLCKYRNGELVVHAALESLEGGVWSLSEDSAGNVWICSYDMGLYRVAPSGLMRHWTTDQGLTSNGVRCVVEDRERNLWVGTSGGGLMQFAARRVRALRESEGLFGRVVNSISPDGDGNLWIATYDKGLFRWDGACAKAVTLSDQQGSATLAQSVLADSHGRVWVGTYGEGLWRLDGVDVVRIPDQTVGDGNILALFEDSQNRIWLGGGHAIAMYERDEFQVYGPAQGLAVRGATCFAEDRSGTLWLANRDGIFGINGDGIRELVDERGDSIQGVGCLHADNTGSLWMGLSRGGMLRWREGMLTRLDHSNGLPVDAVLGIAEDLQRNLWLATNRGVVRGGLADFHAAAAGERTLVCQWLSTRDGLPSDQCPSGRQPTCGRDASGHLWFATQKGVATVDPIAFRVNTTPPLAAIEEFLFHSPRQGRNRREQGRSAENESRSIPPFPPSLVLPPGSRRIEIHYTGLSFTEPGKVRFQVRLDGFDASWQEVGTRRVTHYHELSPGEYVFRVRAANNDGVWDTAGERLAFSVRPHYWQTIWFRVGMATMFVVVGFGVAWSMAHARYRRRRQAADRFRRLVEAAPNAMLAVDVDGRIMLVNMQVEKVFSYGRDELIGQPIEMLLPERFREAHSRHVAEYLAAPCSRPMGSGRALFGRRRDASEFPVEIGLTPVHDSQGRFILVSVLDISQRHERDRELARQRNSLAHLSRVTMLGELSGSLAHELNQPLTAILSNAQAALRFLAVDQPNLEEVREILTEIVEDDNRAGEVIRRLRTLFRKGEMVFQPLDVNSVVVGVLKLVHSDAELRHVELTHKFESELPLVQGDRVQLQQVLLNLLLNAFDACQHVSPGDRHVSVWTHREAPRIVHVRVSDSGPGLSGEAVERLFDPFFTTKSTGMGMGLAISRSIIETHGGQLGVERDLTGGATFWFTLPVGPLPQVDEDG